METRYERPVGPPPENNLVWAILCTVLCCLPFGIVSILKSTKVKDRWVLGDYEGAQQAAEEAKKWAIWGAVAAILLWIAYFLIIVTIGFGGFLAV